MVLMSVSSTVTGSGEKENGLSHGLSRRLLHCLNGAPQSSARTISLISHSSIVMLKVILNWLKPQAKEIIAEEQDGFRAGRSTTDQILSLRILCKKYLQHLQNLYHVFSDF